MTPSETLNFFASVIKSGEPWTEHCEAAYREALSALDRALPCPALAPALSDAVRDVLTPFSKMAGELSNRPIGMGLSEMELTALLDYCGAAANLLTNSAAPAPQPPADLGLETTEEQIATLRKLEKHATPGPWEHDNTECRPERIAYETMYDSGGEKAKSLFGTENSGAAVIHEEYDEWTYFWDETGKCNFAFIAAVRNAFPVLLRDHERLAAEVARLSEIVASYGDPFGVNRKVGDSNTQGTSGCDRPAGPDKSSPALGSSPERAPAPAAAETEALISDLTNFSNGAARKALRLPDYESGDKEWFLGIRDRCRDAITLLRRLTPASAAEVETMSKSLEVLRGKLATMYVAQQTGGQLQYFTDPGVWTTLLTEWIALLRRLVPSPAEGWRPSDDEISRLFAEWAKIRDIASDEIALVGLTERTLSLVKRLARTDWQPVPLMRRALDILERGAGTVIWAEEAAAVCADIREAIRFLPAEGWRATHRHYKGGLYRVIARGRIEADLSPVVIYDNAQGETWVRPDDDFNGLAYNSQGEGVARFAPLPETEPKP